MRGRGAGEQDDKARKRRRIPDRKQKFICNQPVLVPSNGRASSMPVSASFLRLGVNKRVRLITD